jgi:hypothetical protein
MRRSDEHTGAPRTKSVEKNSRRSPIVGGRKDLS